MDAICAIWHDIRDKRGPICCRRSVTHHTHNTFSCITARKKHVQGAILASTHQYLIVGAHSRHSTGSAGERMPRYTRSIYRRFRCNFLRPLESEAWYHTGPHVKILRKDESAAQSIIPWSFFFFVFSFSPIPCIPFALLVSLLLIVVPQIRCHIAGSSLLSPLRFVPCIFIANNVSALSSPVDSRRMACWRYPFFNLFFHAPFIRLRVSWLTDHK